MSRKRNEADVQVNEADVQAASAEPETPANLVWIRYPNGLLDVLVQGSVWHKYALEHGGEETEAPDGG